MILTSWILRSMDVHDVGVKKIKCLKMQFSGSLRANDALYPPKSGLINKHTVKHRSMSKIEIIYK
jgi:hypothetical protein